MATIPTPRTIRRGDRTQIVKNAQGLLRAHDQNPGEIDGIFGQRTEDATKAFQGSVGIDDDGVIGPITWGRLVDLTDPPTLRRGSRGQDVKNAQGLLLAHGFDPRGIDGIFGQNTETATRAFQTDERIRVDGIIGLVTWGELVE